MLNDVLAELIRQRQNQQHEGVAIISFDRQNILADTLSLGGFVQQSVPFRALKRGGNGSFGQLLEFELHRDMSPFQRKEFKPCLKKTSTNGGTFETIS